LREKIRIPLLRAIGWAVAVGLFSEMILAILINFVKRRTVAAFFSRSGITLPAAIFIFLVVFAGTIWWDAKGKAAAQERKMARTARQSQLWNRIGLAAVVVLVLLLPLPLGPYLTEVVDQVGIFILMGLGLNIVVGFAGLLDLGYVAFFAIGAYVMGLLTTETSLGILGLSFWAALPFSVLAAVIAGIILGVPVLRMRGDYLAIVTLGFGEIIRVLVSSDLLKEFIGGAQGILKIGRPELFGNTFISPGEFYYLILASCLLAVFVSWRLRDSRLGRQWMALREDEDVAEAMGIHLVRTKLLAFAIGAAFSGLAGALFASRISSIFPHSFQLLISINVLSLIIVGGIGSLPGVVVGALFLVGLPELLREFKEYRLLMYGALLIAMMLLRPEGIWPSPIRRRELHAEEESAPHELEGETAAAT